MWGKVKTQERPGPAAGLCDDAVCFIGREHEAQRLEEALAKKKSMMVCGHAGIGKTALVKHVLDTLPEEARRRCLYLGGFKNLQDLLRKLLKTLHQAGNPALRRQLRAKGVAPASFKAWLKAASSSQLKGALYRSVEESDLRVIFDHVPPFTPAIAKVIKEFFWMRDTPVYLLLRDAPGYRGEHFSDFFYWGRGERLALTPLPKPAAGELLEQCIRWFGLVHLDLEDFRKEALELSGGVPGAIVKMCAMAAVPHYQAGPHIKTKLIHIDSLISG